MEKFLKAQEARRLLGDISPGCLSLYCTGGIIPKSAYITTRGGHRRFIRTELEKVQRKLNRKWEVGQVELVN